jgi:multicomponent Na+:H+ antiporter subunit E
MAQTLMQAIPLAVLWLILTRQITVPTFITGYVFGIGVVLLLRVNRGDDPSVLPLNPARIPGQLWSIAEHALLLAVEVFVSGVDVARRVLAPRVDINPGLYYIPTQDKTSDAMVSALSAHAITITPGTLVVDYEEINGETIMVVHSLDSAMGDEQSLNEGQAQRVKRINRILGL